MISLARRLGIVLLVACSVAWSAYGPADGTISGTVRNSTGAPFQGAFVRARNVKTKTTVNVLSDTQGRFRVQNLPPGDYEMSHEQDTLGRLNPRTGEVTEYPFPHSEISMREFFLDSQGRLWYASPANDKIGYFIPPSGN